MKIRPTNMHLVHGIRDLTPVADLFADDLTRNPYSCSATMVADDRRYDPFMAAESGAGMDAPSELPTGSIKAFFEYDENGRKVVFGFCQRTEQRQ